MPLDFVGNAISLSGLTGTKLKCEVIGDYYNFWWSITSGGASKNYRYNTSIIELDAATGEVYIKDTKETVLGSAGHALELKTKNKDTYNLKVVLVEKNRNCYNELKKVLRKRWPSINIDDAESKDLTNHSNIYMLNSEFYESIDVIKNIELGNSLFYFDPLRHVTFNSIKTVADGRMGNFYQTGTEFLIFVFTSDWFLGRDDFSPLPNTINESKWSSSERETVNDADSLFGDNTWREFILTNESIELRQEQFIHLYKNRLQKWFRYVLPLPFNPKDKQLFHLILCSNFELGVLMTRNFYSDKTNNPRFSPNNKKTYNLFMKFHPELRIGLRGNNRPLQWRILWKIIKHEGGVCDCICPDFNDVGTTFHERQQYLSWLENVGYIKEWNIVNAWDNSIKQYILDWTYLNDNLGVTAPKPLIPLSSNS